MENKSRPEKQERERGKEKGTEVFGKQEPHKEQAAGGSGGVKKQQQQHAAIGKVL